MSSVELLETQLVNAVAPFVLNARLKPLMEATPGDHKHIVNVSAVEGQFYRPRKTTKHPHTNMAKAALNMMTRTSATDYHDAGINMNSVDTGWVSDEDPVAIAEAKTAEHRFHPAARHRRRRRPNRRPDHRRAQHRHPRVGPVPQGLRADRLVVVDEAAPRPHNAERRRPDLVGGVPRIGRSDGSDVLGFVALSALTDVELDLLTFVEGLVALSRDVGVVDEHVLASLA